MNTQVFQEESLPQGVALLPQGEVVGLPTATVDGLAANGLDPPAVAKIFQAKGRPQDTPLILPVAEASWLSRYCQEIPSTAWQLAQAFWPGALTLILQAKPCVPEIVTAGLPTVGIRCPQHPLALAVLRALDLPLAAPSGNRSGKPSPTTAEAMLQDMAGKIPGILEGGACAVGVESTIVDLRGKPTLLRAGGVSLEAIAQVLGEEILQDPSLSGQDTAIPFAPGMKYRHYAPEAPLTVVQGEDSGPWLAKQVKPGDGVLCFQEDLPLFPHCVTRSLGCRGDVAQQAQEIFSALRYFDQTTVPRIWAQCPQEVELGLAVANRLKKASGFQVISI